VQNDMQKSWMEFHDKQFVLVDLPCRENVNLVDHLMIRAKSFSCSESIKFFLINEIVNYWLFRLKKKVVFLKEFSNKFEIFRLIL